MPWASLPAELRALCFISLTGGVVSNDGRGAGLLSYSAASTRCLAIRNCLVVTTVVLRRAIPGAPVGSRTQQRRLEGFLRRCSRGSLSNRGTALRLLVLDRCGDVRQLFALLCAASLPFAERAAATCASLDLSACGARSSAAGPGLKRGCNGAGGPGGRGAHAVALSDGASDGSSGAVPALPSATPGSPYRQRGQSPIESPLSVVHGNTVLGQPFDSVLAVPASRSVARGRQRACTPHAPACPRTPRIRPDAHACKHAHRRARPGACPPSRLPAGRGARELGAPCCLLRLRRLSHHQRRDRRAPALRPARRC